MDEKKIRVEAHPHSGRRTLLKAVAAAGGAAVATAVVPEGWRKPIAHVGILPAHAQVSNSPPDLFNLLIAPYAPPNDRLRGGGFTHMATFDFEDPLAGVNASALITATIPTGDGLPDVARPVAPCSDPVPAPGKSLLDLGTWGAYNENSGTITFPFTSFCPAPFSLCVTLTVGGRPSAPLCALFDPGA
jgi:hypothetical protein